MRQVAFGMIDVARACGSKVVVNGSDASDHMTEYLARGADYVLLGEAEWTLLELVESIVAGSGRKAGDTAGLAYMDTRTKSAVRTPPRPLMRQLDLLPIPARDLVDIERYRDVWKQSHGFFALNLVASRGCPYRCNWCAKPIYGDTFHLRSPESVAAEMLDLRETYGADYLWFADDLFGIQNDWVQDLAKQVEYRSAAVPFKMQSRVDLMREDTVSALRRAGCAEIWMGVESGSQKILDAMDKGTNIGQIVQARGRLKQNGIRACFFIQFGYPGETWNDIQMTIQLIRDTRPDDIGVSVSYPLPGTKFYERVHEQLGDKSNWLDSEDLSMMFKGAYSSEFYRALHDALHTELKSWNSAEPWPFLLRDASEADSGSHPDRLKQLWAEVDYLQQTCRTPHKTQFPILSCSMADAADGS
jgi:anaerobic magnesium-protoporphyrin IX monomethyl ester cyclase